MLGDAAEVPCGPAGSLEGLRRAVAGDVPGAGERHRRRSEEVRAAEGGGGSASISLFHLGLPLEASGASPCKGLGRENKQALPPPAGCDAMGTSLLRPERSPC